MGNLGAPEIVLLAIFALIFFGPKRLPEIGRQVGRAIAEVRRVSRQFECEVREATEPFEREVREAERMARETYELDDHHSSYGPAPLEQQQDGARAPGGPDKAPDG